MKFDLQSQAVRLVGQITAKFGLVSQAKLEAIQARFRGLSQSTLRVIQPPLSQLTRLRLALPKAVAFGGLALMAVLIVGGLRAVGENNSPPTNRHSPAPAVGSAVGLAVDLPQGWSRLPQIALPKPKSSPNAKSSPKPKAIAPPPAARPAAGSNPAAIAALQALDALKPPQELALADASNYGERYGTDVFGRLATNPLLIVLHETVGSADSAINTFQVAHRSEEMQVSYHSIIRRDGTIIYIVPPQKRAFGAGNSVFEGAAGPETVKTHRQFPPSVNNFAYHISLETPPGGANSFETHSGYSEAQYQSLAWLVAHTGATDDRVTTHRAIDQSGSRIDPRSFDSQRFLSALHRLPRPYLNPG